MNKMELRRKILREVTLKHGVTMDEIRSKRRTPEHVEARIDAATRLSIAGFPSTRIAQLLRRERTVVRYYLKASNSTPRKARDLPIAVRCLPEDIRQVIIDIAECQHTSVEMIIREWLTERAIYEFEAKQRSVGNHTPAPSQKSFAIVNEAA